MSAKNHSEKNLLYFLFDGWAFPLSALKAVYIKSCKLNLYRQKKICLQLENLALIMRFNAFLKHPIIFVQLY